LSHVQARRGSAARRIDCHALYDLGLHLLLPGNTLWYPGVPNCCLLLIKQQIGFQHCCRWSKQDFAPGFGEQAQMPLLLLPLFREQFQLE
jgi:hypothetical protein